MVDVAQLGRAPGCGPGRRGFKSRHPPHLELVSWQQHNSYFVYILFCPVTRKSYVGHTSNLILRFHEHRQGLSRWTRSLQQPWCVHWEEHPTRAVTMQREKRLKSGQGYYERRQLIQQGLLNFAC